MKIQTLTIALALGCSSAVAINAAIHQSVVAQQTTRTAQLSSSQRARLKSLGVKIPVPRYVPAGFSIDSVRTERRGSGGSKSLEYAILYRLSKPQPLCFTIEATNAGIGDPPELASKLPMNSRIFGNGYSLNYGKYTDPDLRKQFPEPDLYTDWLEGNGMFYRLIGAAQTRETYKTRDCKDISPREAVRIAESLQYFNP